jgi:hypothetical protein
VLFQFCDGGDASGQVLKEEVPKRLAGNRRLHASLRENLQEVLVRTSGGVLIPSLGINLSERMLSDIYVWYQFVTKGVYYFELNRHLPLDHSIHLLRPTDERFNIFTDMILHNQNHQKRSLASGEFRYAFVVNEEDQMSLWFYAFKLISMFVLTLPSTFPAKLRANIAKIEWPPLMQRWVRLSNIPPLAAVTIIRLIRYH